MAAGSRPGLRPRTPGRGRPVSRPPDGSVLRATTASGAVVADRVRVASGPWSRFVGLMGRRSLAAGEGLWLVPCGSVHMFFMRMPLDVVFLDREQRVVRIAAGLRPWRATLPVRRAKSALELAAGTCAGVGLAVGETLTLGS